MTIENMFEVATRSKFRFPYRGLVTVEDLWDISVEGLDTVFKKLNSQLKTVTEESLLQKRTKEDAEIHLQIEIIKYIVSTKLKEANSKLRAKEVAEEKQKIMEILASKQDEDLKNKTPEELEKMLTDLNR